MRRGAHPTDCLRAIIAAVYLQQRIQDQDDDNDADDDHDDGVARRMALTREALAYANVTASAPCDLFERARRVGWSLDAVHGFGSDARVTY